MICSLSRQTCTRSLQIFFRKFELLFAISHPPFLCLLFRWSTTPTSFPWFTNLISSVYSSGDLQLQPLWRGSQPSILSREITPRYHTSRHGTLKPLVSVYSSGDRQRQPHYRGSETSIPLFTLQLNLLVAVQNSPFLCLNLLDYLFFRWLTTPTSSVWFRTWRRTVTWRWGSCQCWPCSRGTRACTCATPPTPALPRYPCMFLKVAIL